ncbi:MAG: serine protease [Myxococcota bacterium]
MTRVFAPSLARIVAALVALGVALAPPARAADDADAVWSAEAPLPLAGRHPSRFTVAPLVLDERAARQLAVTADELRVHLIEQARAEGWPVAGAENPLFGQDQSDDARYVLGGEVGELYEAARERREGTGVDIRWELLDRRTDQVVYKVVTRGWLAGTPAGDRSWSLGLVRLALYNVLSRERFLEALEAPHDGGSLPPSGLARLRACPARTTSLPDGFDQVLPAVVALRNGAATGTGTVVSPDGFVVTSAQLVEGADAVEVALHRGPLLQAQVLQYDTAHDLALVRMQGSNFACTPVAGATPGVGQPVYQIGAGAKVQGGVASGVVSGIRVVDETDLLQTDIATAASSSGGPLLNTQGGLVGILSDRIAGRAAGTVAIPVRAVERWLGLQFGERSDPFAPTIAPEAPAPEGPVTDTPDPPVAPRDAQVCLFRRGGGPQTTFDVADQSLRVGARQFACLPVPAGSVSIARSGALASKFRIKSGDTLYLLVVGKSLSRSVKAEFERAQAKGIEDASPGQQSTR